MPERQLLPSASLETIFGLWSDGPPTSSMQMSGCLWIAAKLVPRWFSSSTSSPDKPALFFASNAWWYPLRDEDHPWGLNSSNYIHSAAVEEANKERHPAEAFHGHHQRKYQTKRYQSQVLSNAAVPNVRNRGQRKPRGFGDKRDCGQQKLQLPRVDELKLD